MNEIPQTKRVCRGCGDLGSDVVPCISIAKTPDGHTLLVDVGNLCASCQHLFDAKPKKGEA